MKYKLTGIASFVILAVISVAVSFAVRERDENIRVHQHLSAMEKPLCTTHNNDKFCTHLPIVSIETGGMKIPGGNGGQLDMFNEHIAELASNGETMEKVKVSVFDNENKNNHLTDTPAFTAESLIRLRGHASRDFEKGQYLLKFVNEDGTDRDIGVMGMSSHNEWVLNGPYLDKTLVRNYMWYNISGELMEWAPNIRYCEVFLDGDYRGVYLMVENITSGKNNRLRLTVTEKGTVVSGYLYRLDRISEADLGTDRGIYPFSERSNHLRTDIAIRYPGQTKLTPELAKEIELEISQFEKAIYSYDYDSGEHGYLKYVDLDSIVDYFIICEMTKNMDMGRYSTYIYKRPGEKYKFCVWDFNNACDNFPSGRDETGVYDFSIVDKPYFEAFTRDEKFTERVVERYRELRKTFLNHDYLMSYIDDTIDYLGTAVERNNVRWAEYIQSDEALQPVERNVHSQKEAVRVYKSFLRRRGEWLDEGMESLLQYSAESKVKQYNEVTE